MVFICWSLYYKLRKYLTHVNTWLTKVIYHIDISVERVALVYNFSICVHLQSAYYPGTWISQKVLDDEQSMISFQKMVRIHRENVRKMAFYQNYLSAILVSLHFRD